MNHVTKRKAIVYLLAIFIAGAACGSIVGYSSGRQQSLVPARQKEMSERTLQRLQTRLNLTEEQHSKIKPIVEQNSATMQNIHRESLQRVSDTYKRMNAKLALHLTREQKQKLDEMESERCENVRKKCGTPKASADTKDARDGKKSE